MNAHYLIKTGWIIKMFDQDVNRLISNFSRAFQELEKKDFFSLEAFKNRYQASLVALGCAATIPLAPFILDALVNVIGIMLNALSMTSYVYSAFHFLKFIYLVSSAAVDNSVNLKSQQDEALTKAVCGFLFGCSFESLQILNAFASQLFSTVAISLLGIRLFKSLPDTDGVNLSVGPLQASFRLNQARY
jgi:hypothetical protein